MASDAQLRPAPLSELAGGGRVGALTKVRAPAVRWARGIMGAVLVLAAQAGATRAQSAAPSNVNELVSEAAARFGLPQAWIIAVMRIESGFEPRAVSSAGAMGLMQVMPATYAELRVRHGLGADPFHPRDNILAGAAYLRDMYERFGAPGFLAAYNAGPARYQDHLARGRPLPLETQRYVAALSSAVAGGAVRPPAIPAVITPPPTLFVALGVAPRSASAPTESLFVALTRRGAPP